MQLESNTVLITGGGSGIGLGLAQRFLKAGSKVIVCGRDEGKLQSVRENNPGLITYRCDVAKPADREELVRWATREHPELNVVINNAGIQRRLELAQPEPWADCEAEITTNLHAPVHLCRLFISHLLGRERPVLMNVTSGLAFLPAAFVPVYAATKAALHSFTMSLRQQLDSTPIRVVEIVPPAVSTDLGGAGVHASGVPLDEYSDALFQSLGRGELEIGYGFSEKVRLASRTEIDEMLKNMKARAPMPAPESQ